MAEPETKVNEKLDNRFYILIDRSVGNEEFIRSNTAKQ